MFQPSTRRTLLIGCISLAVLLAGIFVYKTFQDSNDREEIKALIEKAKDHLKAREWKELSELTWPPQERAEKRQDIEMAELAVFESEPKIEAITLRGTKAHFWAEVEYRFLLSSKSSFLRVEFFLGKHQGKWYVEDYNVPDYKQQPQKTSK